MHDWCSLLLRARWFLQIVPGKLDDILVAHCEVSMDTTINSINTVLQARASTAALKPPCCPVRPPPCHSCGLPHHLACVVLGGPGALDLAFSHYCWLAHATAYPGESEPPSGQHKLSCQGYWRLVKDAGLCADIDDMGACVCKRVVECASYGRFAAGDSSLPTMLQTFSTTSLRAAWMTASSPLQGDPP